MLAIAAAVTLLAMARDATRLVTALVGAGVVVAAAGVRSGGRGGTTAVIAGVAIVATLASLASRRSLIVVVPAALVLGVRLGPALAATPTSRWLAVALGVAAGALVIVPAVVRRLSGRGFGAVLVPWTLLAAVGPVVGTTAAARPLAVGAVLAVALGGELSLLAAVPGAAVLVYALADGHGWSRAALWVLVAVTALGLTFDRLRPDGLDAVSASDRAARLGVIDGAVLALASWFVIRPTSWAWTHVGDLDAYSDGTAIALASALIAGVLLTISGGRLERTPLTPWFGAASDDDVASSTKVDALTVGIVALTGLIAAALVRSARL
jgi:hypothetical protein